MAASDSGFGRYHTLTGGRPEVLAPVGTWDMLRAALTHGADAVYFGCSHLNARSGQAAFQPSDLPELVRRCHQSGARAYLAMNILTYDKEWQMALSLAEAAVQAGVDALLLQDYGLLSALRAAFPNQPWHASTQMNVGSPESIRRAAAAGCSRIILPRESSLMEIRAYTELAHGLGVETEVFVHGALCVSVSGACHLSRLRGGRSANRGDCACPCRLDWTLTADGRPVQAGRPLLSPKDQSASAHVEALAEIGVDSLKIEGRLRQPVYVATAAEHYRNRLSCLKTDDAALLLAFNRGGSFTDAFMADNGGADFLSGRSAGSYGIRIGVVVEADSGRGWLYIRPDGTPGAIPGNGDVVAVRRAGTHQAQGSAPVAQVETVSGLIRFKGFHPDVLNRIHRGDPAFRMTDHAAAVRVAGEPWPSLPVAMALSSAPDMPADASASLYLKIWPLNAPERSAVVSVPQQAGRAPLDSGRIRAQLMKLGGTDYSVSADHVTIDSARPILLPVSGINALRRAAVEALNAVLRRPMPPGSSAAEGKPAPALADAPLAGSVRSAGLLQAPGTVSASVSIRPAAGIRTAYPWMDQLPPELDAYGLRVALPVDTILTAWRHDPAGLMMWKKKSGLTALDALLPPAAGLKFWQDWEAGLMAVEPGVVDAVLTHQGRISAAPDCHADTGANVINRAAFDAVSAWPCPSVTISPELTAEETTALLDALDERAVMRHGRADDQNQQPAATAELLIYGRERTMLMKHCPIGLRQPGCSKCAGHTYHLTDGRDRHYPLLTKPKSGCWTEIWSAEPINRMSYMERWLRGSGRAPAAPRLVRLTFTDEFPEQQRTLLNRARAAVGSLKGQPQ